MWWLNRIPIAARIVLIVTICLHIGPSDTIANNHLATLNCVDLNLSVNQLGLIEFELGELIPGADPMELHHIQIETSYGAIIYQDGDEQTNSLVSFSACDYIGQTLEARITNESGASCWGKLTLKQSNGPVFIPRFSAHVFCNNTLVNSGDILDVKPLGFIPCNGIIEGDFVADWVIPYPCNSDTAKVILREYEAFDKSGRRGTITDTIVVSKLPQIFPIIVGQDLRNIGCPEQDTLYCGVNDRTDSVGVTPIGPYLLVEEFPSIPAMDIDGDGVNCDTIYFCGFQDGNFIDLFTGTGTKCGLTIHKDVQIFGGICERQYKVTIDIKQDCYKTPVMLDCTPVGSQNVQIIAPGYYRCEFWLTDLDTLPPLFAPKVFNEFECLTIDTGFIGGSDLGFLDIFQPVVYTTEHDCEAYSYLPPLCVFDDWSGIKMAKATVEGGGTYLLQNDGEKCHLLDLGEDGETIALEDYVALFGEDLDEILNDSIIDLLEEVGLLSEGLCYRSHEKIKLIKSDRPTRIFYEVYDSCHLIARDTAYIHVKDNTRPVVVADKGVTVSLSDKKVWVDAEVFDEGSWDNCGVNMILARRSDWTESCVDLCYNKKDESCDSDSMESALCWLWTDGHDTLWTLNLEDDKRCDEVEAHYQKQLDWYCKDETPCGRLMYNSWLYDMIKYATVTCKSNGYLDDHGFDELFYRAVGNPQVGDMVRIKNEDFLTFIDTALGGLISDSLFMGEDIISFDSLGILNFYGVDVFKCQEFSSVVCGDLEGGLEELFLQVFLQIFFDNCFPFFGTSGPDFDLFIPAVFPENVKRDLFSEWKSIGGGWSDAVPFSCEDACGPVTVEILVMDYWCNWSTAWTKVWVEDKTPIKIPKDVVDEEVITCKLYKDDNYAYPGEEHPVSIQYIVDQAKAGEQDGFDALDGVFGGYCKAWVDPYGNYVDIEGNTIDCDIPFYDSICDCKDTMIQVKVYDDHLGYLWKDSVVRACYYEVDSINFQKGIVVVNCSDNVQCEQEVWCEFDHCGKGYIFRKFKIWQGCPEGSYEGLPDSLRHPVDTIFRHQRIWVGNECELDKYMFDVPYDTEVYSCEIQYGPDGNTVGVAGPENTGYATYKFDDDCRIVGIAHEDKVFKIVGGDAACYKILRTWYFADWCGTGGVPAQDNWWYERAFVVDSCVQKIIVVDTAPPVCIITGPAEDGGSVEIGGCSYDLSVEVDASDACGINKYYWELKDLSDDKEAIIVDSGDGELNMDTLDNFTITSEDVNPGYYVLKVEVQDECSNESYCEYHIQVESGKKPAPVCVTSVTARLTPWDTNQDGEVDSAHAVVWAEEFNSSSALACDDDSIAYRLEFIDQEGDSTYVDDTNSLALGCDDIGTHLVRLWVLSYPSGTADFCDVVLIVQSDFSGCGSNVGTGGNGSAQQIGMQTEHQDKGDARSMMGDVNHVRIPADASNSNHFGMYGYQLGQNRPNPFRDETTVEFTLPSSMSATITVYDVTGRTLRIVTGEFAKGFNSILFKKEDIGADGILYYQLKAGDFVATRKMLLIK